MTFPDLSFVRTASNADTLVTGTAEKNIAAKAAMSCLLKFKR